MGTGEPYFNAARRDTTMTDKSERSQPAEGDRRPDAGVRDLPPAAKRALAEAEARRCEYLEREKRLPKELGGRGGKDPARYGDWELKGRSIDF